MNRALVVIALALAACKSKPHPADVSLFASMTPPGDLAKIKPGMTLTDVKKLFPVRWQAPGRVGHADARRIGDRRCDGVLG